MPRDGEPPAHSRTALEELTDVLDVAARVANELLDDPSLQAVIEAFRLMPLEDRAVLAAVVQREVQARRLSLATESTTGQSMHPNPNARLYLRSHEKAVPRGLLERDELMLAMLAGLRVTPILLVPDIHATWLDATRAAVQHVEPAARRAAGQLMREALELVEADDASETARAS
jgi:hypothetical protein